MKPSYTVGDRVEVINFGHPIFESKKHNDRLSLPLITEDEYFRVLDMKPEIVGKEGVVTQVIVTQGIPKYAVEGIPGKYAWYIEKQLYPCGAIRS